MRKGEKLIVGLMAVSVVVLAVVKVIQHKNDPEPDKGIPYFSTASQELTTAAAKILHTEKCSDCHSLWGTRDLTAAVPAPPLDGMSVFHDEEWFFKYFSAENPQEILPSRLKPVYRMPSYAHLSETERKTLAAYMASLKVEDWYLEETKKRRYEKLTGKDYTENVQTP